MLASLWCLPLSLEMVSATLGGEEEEEEEGSFEAGLGNVLGAKKFSKKKKWKRVQDL